jgi:hypothetical protein
MHLDSANRSNLVGPGQHPERPDDDDGPRVIDGREMCDGCERPADVGGLDPPDGPFVCDECCDRMSLVVDRIRANAARAGTPLTDHEAWLLYWRRLQPAP